MRHKLAVQFAKCSFFGNLLVFFTFTFVCYGLQELPRASADVSGDIGVSEAITSETQQGLPVHNSDENLYENLIVRKIDYDIDGVPVYETAVRNRLREQTFLKIGTPISRFDVQRSVKSLYSSAAYSQINVYAQVISEGVVLKFQLTSVARIEKIEVKGVPDGLRSAIQNTIQSKPGEAYVPVFAKNDVERIKRVCGEHGYFNVKALFKIDTIVSDSAERIVPEGRVNSSREDESLNLSDTSKARALIYQITLGTPSRIAGLQIRGHAAMSAGRIKAACRLGIDDIYRKTAVEADIQSIRELYRKNRYYTPIIVPHFDPKTGVLQFRIDEGKQVLLEFVASDIKIDEKALIEEARFSSTSPALWQQSIIRYFEKRGYIGTTVDEIPLAVGPLKGKGGIKFIINPGVRYVVTRVTFSGNQVFSAAQLLQEMELHPTEGVWRLFGKKRFFDKQILKKDRQRLKILYEKTGYPYASIETIATPDKDNANKQNIGEMAIHVIITESYKEVIHRCRFQGNRAVGTDILLQHLPSDFQLPQPNVRFVRIAYQNAVEKSYHERGYIDVTVEARYIAQTETPIFQVEADFSEALDEGRLPGKLQMEFVNRDLPLAGTFIALKIGELWSIQDVAGNPRYSLIQRQTYLEVFEHGMLHLNIFEGEQSYFGKFHFEGELDVKSYVLTREVAHLQGTLYTPTKLNEAVQNLYDTGIFQRVQPKHKPRGTTTATSTPGTSLWVAGKRTEKDTYPATILPKHISHQHRETWIELQRQKPGAYGGGIGYSSLDGIRLSFRLRHWNLLQRNIRGSLRGRLGTRGYLYDATLTEPWLVRRIHGSLQFSGRNLEEDDNVQALQGNFILSRKFARAHLLNLQYNYRNLRQQVEENLRDISFSELEAQRTTVSSLRFTWAHDSRSPYLNPTSGMLNEVTLEYAGGFLQGETSFVKTTTDFRYYQQLSTSGPVLATALRFGITNGLGSNRRAELISFERFWAGGMNTIRGYAERGLGPLDSTGRYRGDVRLIFNTELRSPNYALFDILHLGGVAFFDTGNVWGSVDDIALETLPSAVGVGLRLTWGPITGGIDYAVPLLSIPGVSENTSYLQLGSTF